MESFISSIIAALIGGSLALIGVYYSHKLQLSQQRKQQQEVIRGFLQAILTELETCWNRAEETVNPYIQRHEVNTPFEIEVSIKTDFFTVYNNNSQSLGSVTDGDLRNLIVATYTRYKALVESYSVNTELLRNWKQSKHLHSIAKEEDLKEHFRKKMQSEYLQLVVFAGLLKTDHLLLKKQIDILIPALRKSARE